MFDTPFYNGIIRKTVLGFGTLFSNIKIVRSISGSPAQTVSVPLAYGPKEKWHVKVDQDPELDNRIYTSLPRLSFEVTGYNYDAARMVNRANKIKMTTATGTDYMYAPVPYNLDISLYSLTKGTEDGLAIVEQILPIFAPEYSLNMMALPDQGIAQDVPIILNSVTVQDDFEGDFATRRFVTHTFNFTAKIMLYHGVATGKPITMVDANLDTMILANGELHFNATGDLVTRIKSDGVWTP